MNYEDMSDFEINKAVAFAIRGRDEVCVVDTPLDRLVRIFNGNAKSEDDAGWVDFDPCNNPSDAWPIILQTCMTIELPDPNLGGIGTNTIYNPRGTDWQCDYEDKDKCFRAAMICFLKMKDAEK